MGDGDHDQDDEEPGPVASSTLGWTATLRLATLDRWGLTRS
jgi:hypothetical protein